jgi:hypothetical protein
MVRMLYTRRFLDTKQHVSMRVMTSAATADVLCCTSPSTDYPGATCLGKRSARGWSWWCSSWSDNGEQSVPSAYHQHGKPLHWTACMCARGRWGATSVNDRSYWRSQDSTSCCPALPRKRCAEECLARWLVVRAREVGCAASHGMQALMK